MTPEKDFLQFLLASIVDAPEKIIITEQKDALGILLEVSIAEDDMGRVIGKGGQTIQAIRTIVRLIGSKRHERVNVRILESKEVE